MLKTVEDGKIKEVKRLPNGTYEVVQKTTKGHTIRYRDFKKKPRINGKNIKLNEIYEQGSEIS